MNKMVFDAAFPGDDTIDMVSAAGVFDDGWMGLEATLVMETRFPVSLYFFIPPRDDEPPQKTLKIYSNDRKLTVEASRGTLTQVSGFEPVGGRVSIQLYCDSLEPFTPNDRRQLTVLLARVEAKPNEGQAFNVMAEPEVAAPAATGVLLEAELPDPVVEPLPVEPAVPDLAGQFDAFEGNAISALFDAEFYLSGFLTGEEPDDPIQHYLTIGYKQGREPAPWFSRHHYLALNPDVAAVGMNAFLHYCLAGKAEGRKIAQLGYSRGKDAFSAHAAAVEAGPHFEEFDPDLSVGRRKRAKVIAYYLPQFHTMEVNDDQWGKGFTEWRNLPRAQARFAGHIQPKVPRDLGCYNLATGDTMHRQIEMARAAGIHGFCYYHYWFDGKRVLETPMERLLADPTLDFPFCLMWANENWTRTWDGSEKEVILGQNYRDEDDIPFIDDVARHMKDSRYIRVNGRPLFFIYRPGHIPNSRERLAQWRDIFKSRHGLDPLIFNAQAFGDNDPREFGLDGAIEFPPHKILTGAPDVSGQMALLDTSFTGDIRRYEDIVAVATSEPPPEFPLIRTVFPSWDNDARRPGRSTIITDSTPDKFAGWLDWAIRHAEEHPIDGEAFVCINAWNEWAEGAYLEPDVHFGAAYLNTVSRVVHSRSMPACAGERAKVVVVGHDILAFGAQKLVAHIGATLKDNFGVDVTFLILSSETHGGGFATMTETYKKIGEVIFADQETGGDASIVERLKSAGIRMAITNTTSSGRFAPLFKEAGFTVVSLIHELPNLLRSYKLEDCTRSIAAASDFVIFPAEPVKKGFEGISGEIRGKSEIFPQGLYNTTVLETPLGDNGLRAELGLSAGTRVVLGAGYADMRKGIDRFVSVGLSVCSTQPDVAFLWAGDPSGEMGHWLRSEIEAAGMQDRVRILGHRDDIARLFASSNAYYLSSREDPFPSVVLEALACGLPVIGHAGCGGCDSLIQRHGILVPPNDPVSAADAISSALAQRSPRAAAARRREVTQNHDFASYIFGLLSRLMPQLRPLSVVVPNYKYDAYIGERLHSIFDQAYPLREVLVLDDASPDNSVVEIQRTVAAANRVVTLDVNEVNSGSPFPQWRKGVEMAQGEYVWIAEADDLAEPSFVSDLMDQMRQAGSVLGFVDSRQVNEHGAQTGESYRPYINQIEAGAFDRSFDMAGPEFLARYLSVKNVILNVSGVIAHRQTLLDAFDAVGGEIHDYSVAGDWRLYAEICAKPGVMISYLGQALNIHRRHSISVTHALKAEKHLAEISTMHEIVRSKVVLSAEQRERQDENYAQCRQHLLGSN